MTTHKEIFLKHGLHPPRGFQIPTSEQINAQVNVLRSFWGSLDFINYYHYAAFYLSLDTTVNDIKISDHDLFASSFNLKYDSAKIHPDLFYKLNFYANMHKDKTSSAIRCLWYDFEFTTEELDEFLIFFFPGYELQKLFSPHTKDTLTRSLYRYVEEVLDNSFDKYKSPKLGVDLYEYTLQEQQKLKLKV